MPEIGEVARAVHYIRKHLAGKTLAKVTAQTDENVYGKVGCSAEAFQKALTGKKVVDARQQGKYFWIEMSSPPHPLMHFGMAGWLKFKTDETSYYKPQKSDGPQEWPPKYWKFVLQTKETPDDQAAYVDLRRFGRIRLIDCPANEIRKVSPLVENGPDPVQDPDIFTEDWLKEKVRSKHVPIKALLLDQGNISGIGNWVGDELLYDAKIHPEQYSDTLSDAQIAQLFNSIRYICTFAVDNLADSSKFPEEWLFKHRWGKGKKDSPSTLPNGKKFVYMTVGGRTSCVVPSVQKKTGPVAGDVKTEPDDGANGDAGTGKPQSAKRKSKANEEENKEKPGPNKKQRQVKKEDTKEENVNGAAKKKSARETSHEKGKTAITKKSKSGIAANGVKSEIKEAEPGRRRSARTSGK